MRIDTARTEERNYKMGAEIWNAQLSGHKDLDIDKSKSKYTEKQSPTS